MNKNEQLNETLSAYIDNELSNDENIKIKKLTIANNNARKELENMYKFQKLIHSAFERTKSDVKKDFSKNVVAEITNEDYYSTNYFQKLALIFITIICAIIGGFIYLYF